MSVAPPTEEMDEALSDDLPIGPDNRPVSKKVWAIRAGLVVAGVAAAFAIVAVATGGGDDAPAVETRNTAEVTVTDVVATETLSGTLGYGETQSIVHRTSTDGITTLSGLVSGIVTSVVGEGDVIESGDVLYEVNAAPVVVLAGDTPVYRTFHSRMTDGPDVEQLEQALVDLGFDPDGDIEIDEDFTSATANAIELLQESIGAEETGRLDLGYVVFSPIPVFVGEVFVSVGDQTGQGMPIVATSKSLTGTVTAESPEGSTVDQGDVLVQIDGSPIVLMLGELPAYRTLSQGDVGDDVLQLEAALADLGFGTDSMTVDGDFDDETLAAVVAWQESVGAPTDGVVNLGDIVFLPEPIRIGEALASVGDVVMNGTPIAAASESATTVLVELSTDDQDLVAVGDAVVVKMPSGEQEAATITDIGTVVMANQQGGTFFEMTVVLDSPDAASELDQAPVDVEVVSDRADGVLAVPVAALVALSEGGYAVEVVDASGVSVLVAVDPGLFADGRVEITASGLTAGMEVVIP